MRLLLTGATGLLGTAVRRAAAGQRDVELVPTTRRPPADGWLHLDLVDPASIDAAIGAARPDAILHTAAVTAPVWAESHPEEATAVNTRGSELLAEAAARRRIHLTVVSTDLVFSGRREGQYREADATDPRSHYARTKLAAEAAVAAVDPTALVVRTSLLIGPGCSHVAGLARALDGPGDGPTLFTDERRSPILAVDLARAVLELVTARAGGLLHLGGPEGLSRYELGQRIARALGLDAGRIRPALAATSGAQPPRPGDITLDSARALALLGSFRPRRIDEDPGELA